MYARGYMGPGGTWGLFITVTICKFLEICPRQNHHLLVTSDRKTIQAFHCCVIPLHVIEFQQRGYAVIHYKINENPLNFTFHPVQMV